jgi:stage V sporulation protein AC
MYMGINEQEYEQMQKKAAPKSPVLKNCIFAFLIGGFICTIGEIVVELSMKMGLDQQTARMICCVALIGISVLLTALQVFDNIAKFAGAGTIVPITGFANAIASPAIEFKSEGFILGVGAKMFTIAGPVIVYGVSASVVYGLIYWAIQKL